MNFACPGLLGAEDYFVQKYGIPIDKGKYKDATNSQKKQAIRAFKVIV
jgi:SNF2 family DNA or RNA helicase